MEKENKKNKRRQRVISFAVPEEVYEELKTLKQHTTFIKEVVMKSVNCCPSCHRPWPKKDVKTPEKTDW
jgi:hypothetical protein